MFNPEPNLAEWQESARELLNNPRLTRYLEHLDRGVKEYRASLPEGERPAEFYDHRANLLKFAEAALPIQDESMRGYAGHWAALSAHHDQTGVYKRCVDFFQHDQGLLVDLGCGTGRFLAATNTGSAIGVDINHYCLQAAETLLAGKGPVQRYSRSYISFDPERGFILKPYPVMNVKLDGTTLLLDDIQTLHNTMGVLYNQGRKADMVSFTLSGGYTNNSPLQFIDAINLGDKFREEKLVKHGEVIRDTVISKLGKICKSGGRFFFAYRMAVSENEVFVDGHEKIGQEMAKLHPNIDVVRTSSLAMEDENGMHGIGLDRRRIEKDGTITILPDSAVLPYRLYLFDMRLR